MAGNKKGVLIGLLSPPKIKIHNSLTISITNLPAGQLAIHCLLLSFHFDDCAGFVALASRRCEI
jgi:hypothetical protein